MPFPNFPGKHRRAPLYASTEYVRYAARRRGSAFPPSPPSVVLVFGRGWRRYLTRTYGRPVLREYGLYRASRAVGISAVNGPGAPNAALYVEELRALGARRFVVVGMAGSLQPTAGLGSVVLCSKSLRDEGTSHHYARAARWARPSRGLTTTLAATLDRHDVQYVSGPSWTTDAPYRETVAELRRYRDDGVVTVEMEAAAVFSVARCLGCEAAALFVISDRLDERGWEPRFFDSPPRLRQALGWAIEACAHGPTSPTRRPTQAPPARALGAPTP